MLQPNSSMSPRKNVKVSSPVSFYVSLTNKQNVLLTVFLVTRGELVYRRISVITCRKNIRLRNEIFTFVDVSLCGQLEPDTHTRSHIFIKTSTLQQHPGRDATRRGTQTKPRQTPTWRRLREITDHDLTFVRSFRLDVTFVSFRYVCRCAHGTKVVENQIVFGIDPSESPEVEHVYIAASPMPPTPPRR